MTRNETVAPLSADEALAAAAAWIEEEHAILRGINHSLSNRVAAISALAGVFEPDEAPGDRMTGALVSESKRLEGLLRIVRVLAGTPGAGPEPLQLSEFLAQAVTLHAQHADFREGATEVVAIGDADAMPVVAPAAPLTYALLVLLSAARRAAGGMAVVRFAGDETSVVVTVAPEPAAALESDAAHRAVCVARWLLRDADATVRATDGAFEVRLVTLAEVRRRRKAAE